MPIEDVLDDDFDWNNKEELPEEVFSEANDDEEIWEWEDEEPTELDFFHPDEITVRLLAYRLPGKAQAAKRKLHSLGFPCSISDLSIGHPFGLEQARYGLFVLEGDAENALEILNDSKLIG